MSGTVEGLKGDVFEVLRESGAELLMIFGHGGFNNLSADLTFRDPLGAGDLRLSSEPGDETDGLCQRLPDGRWFIGRIDHQTHTPGRGLGDERVTEVFSETFKFMRTNGLRSLVTNGIQDVEHPGQRRSWLLRARMLCRLAEAQDGIRTLFVSKSGVFDRLDGHS